MSAKPCEDLVLALEDVIPEGFDRLPPDAPVVAVVVSLTFPGMVGESYGIMRDFTRSVFDQLLESGARAVLIDSAAADPQSALAAEAAQVFGPSSLAFAEIESACAALESHLKPGVTVLIKASRVMELDRLVNLLAAGS